MATYVMNAVFDIVDKIQPGRFAVTPIIFQYTKVANNLIFPTSFPVGN